jgi:hypothetical protein
MRILKISLTVVAIFISINLVDRVGSPKVMHIEWTKVDSKAYARDRLLELADKEWICLDKLWTKESHWESNAYNKVKVMGKNAGGIPQLLNLSPSTPPTMQIDRGLAYIVYRYKTPCTAWKHEQRKGWY